MRLSLFTAALIAGAPLGMGAAQFHSPQPAVDKTPPKPVIAKPTTGSTGGGAITPTIVTSFVGGNDNCASAASTDAISGLGTFAVNTTAATTGAPLGSCGAIGRDVWFYWTATTTETVTISTCGQTGADTVIAAWADGSPAGSCPTTQITCLDDFCGLQTQISLAATAGTSYFLEFGSFAGGAGYSANFTIAGAPPPVTNDDCTNPTPISGNGTFPLNTVGATTGSPLGSCGAMGTDVWFYYSATTSGIATISTCGQVSGDSVIAVWADGSPAGSCPTQQIACLDDSCGLQTSLNVCVQAGTNYFIEIGRFAGGPGYTGTFSVNVVPTPPPTNNDDCSMPVNLVGDGPHPFDTTGDTTGCEGQSESACLFFGFTNMYNDEWYTWTAGTTGLYELTLCNGTSHPDTRLAVYQGAGCPALGSAIACNDDVCGFVSAVCFSAVAGQVYTIQIGAFGSTQTGSGNMQFIPQTGGPSPCGDQDDGSSENVLGLTAGGSLMWMTGFGAGAASSTISEVSTCFGTPLFPGFTPSGPVTIAVYDDPNDDGDPTDGVLVSSTTAIISPGSVDTDVFQSIPLPSAVTINGLFFVTATVNHTPGQFPGPLDQSGGGSVCGGGGNPGAWVAGNTSGTMNFNNLAANDVPPLNMALIGFPGNWLLRVTCGPGGPPGTAYCFGDGTGTACPCGTGAAGNGCPNSVNAAGANLTATGNAIVAADTLVLTGSGMPATATALYYQGDMQISVVFGDGLRCVSTSIVRLGTKTNVGGSSSYPGPGDLSVSVRGGVSAGQSKNYQGWYRNAAAFCTPATFNLTNGMNIVWQ